MDWRRLALALCIVSLPVPALAQEEARLSLVIGIQDYTGGAELIHARADALAVNNALKSIIFSRDGETPLLDADRGDILAAVDALANHAADARRRGAFVTVIVYFSGHGMGVPGLDNDIYLLPKNFSPAVSKSISTDEMEARAIRLANLRQKLAASADQVVFLIDACRSQTFGLTGQPKPVEATARTTSRVAMLFAAQPGRVAPDDGAFSAALSKRLAQRTSVGAIAFDLSGTRGLTSYYTETDSVSLKPRTAADASQSEHAPAPTLAAYEGSAAIIDARSYGTDIRNAAIPIYLRNYVQKQGLNGMATLAENGDATAQFMLGLAYSFGLRIKPGEMLPEDYDKAADWSQRALLGGEARAANTLAFIYAEGRTGPKNEREAIRLWKAGAERQVPAAMANLSIRYRDGGPGIEQDIPHAIRLLEAAGKMGYGRAYFLLGLLFNDPKQTQIYDPMKAINYYKLADALQNASGAYNLAVMYENGNGVVGSDEEANRWYRRAAQLGDPDAARILSTRAYNRTGFGSISPEKALVLSSEYLKRAADVGDIEGIQLYATRLLEGRGVKENAPEGMRLLREAGQYGSVGAKISLARILLKNGNPTETRSLLGEFVATNFRKPDPAIWPGLYYSAALVLRDLPDEGDLSAPGLKASEFRAVFGPARKSEESSMLTLLVPFACYPEGVAGKPTTIGIDVFDWQAASDMASAEIEWIERQGICRAPNDVKVAFAKLYAIARENKVNFQYLVKYALGKSDAPAPAVSYALAGSNAAPRNATCPNPPADASGEPWKTAPSATAPTGAKPVEIDEALLNEKVVILLQGKNIDGTQIYTYLQLTLRELKRLRDKMRAACDFIPSEYGNVLAAGSGEPSAELRARMTQDYNMGNIYDKKPST